MNPLPQAPTESYARSRRPGGSRWTDPFLWTDGTEYNVQWPLYDPPSPLCRQQRRREVYYFDGVLVCVEGAVIRHAPGRCVGRFDRSWRGGREGGRESLLDVRQRRTSMSRGKCGVTSPSVINSQELSCAQERGHKTNFPLPKPLSQERCSDR